MLLDNRSIGVSKMSSRYGTVTISSPLGAARERRLQALLIDGILKGFVVACQRGQVGDRTSEDVCLVGPAESSTVSDLVPVYYYLKMGLQTVVAANVHV